jgi:hypothetical protein
VRYDAFRDSAAAAYKLIMRQQMRSDFIGGGGHVISVGLCKLTQGAEKNLTFAKVNLQHHVWIGHGKFLSCGGAPALGRGG